MLVLSRYELKWTHFDCIFCIINRNTLLWYYVKSEKTTVFWFHHDWSQYAWILILSCWVSEQSRVYSVLQFLKWKCTDFTLLTMKFWTLMCIFIGPSVKAKHTHFSIIPEIKINSLIFHLHKNPNERISIPTCFNEERMHIDSIFLGVRMNILLFNHFAN